MSENLNLKTITTIDPSPFKHLCVTIGELPSTFVESMSYYELLAWFVNYLENTVIPAVNANGEATAELQELFVELKTFVDTYFDNLDVQEEINNKLDEMAEEGTLQEIITTYIQSNVAWTFDTVADMKLATNLVAGSYARTLGFHSINDGGGATYHITNTGTANERDVIAIDSLFAVLVLEKQVTPEMYGAYGDNTHSDTDAWQGAVDSGRDVKAFNKTYRVGKITVTKNINIDCGQAKFVCTADTLFDFKGNVDTSVLNAGDYTANQSDYAISGSSYSGFAFLRGDNNFAPERTYYVGGFPAMFNAGKMENTYPVDVENTEIDLITPITFNLSNIGDISHTSSTTNIHSIKVTYGLNSTISNINIENSTTYVDIDVDKSMYVKVDNMKALHDVQFDDNISYIVYFGGSAYCSLTNSVLHNKYWHAFTTSGIYLTYCSIIDNCTLTSENGIACADHGNALGTTITNSTISCVGVGGLSYINNCKILSNRTANKNCAIYLFPVYNKAYADYTIKNTYFTADAGASSASCGILLSHSPQVTGLTYYYSHVLIENVRHLNDQRTRCFYWSNRPSTSNYKFGVVEFINNNLDFTSTASTETNVDISEYVVTIRDCNTYTTGTSYMAVGGNGYRFTKLIIENSKVGIFKGNIGTLVLTNFDANGNITDPVISDKIIGTNIMVNIADSVLLNPTEVNVTNMRRSSGYYLYNITKRGTALYAQAVDGSTGAMTPVAITE